MFSDICLNEILRILNEDGVHFSKLVWMPTSVGEHVSNAPCDNEAVGEDVPCVNITPTNSVTSCAEGVVTRKRSNESMKHQLSIVVLSPLTNGYYWNCYETKSTSCSCFGTGFRCSEMLSE